MKIKTLPLLALVLMTILSFANLAGLHISGIAICVGIVFYFINRIVTKEPNRESGLDFKAVGPALKSGKNWLWIALPLIMDAVCVGISLLFIPQYIEYETARAGSFVAIELSIASTVQFFIFALGEEIAWRAFFQRQLCKAMPAVPVLLVSSALFALGHYEGGNPLVVAYGLVFVFINSVLYGVIFHKTRNAWVSALSHFAANMFEVILFVLL